MVHVLLFLPYLLSVSDPCQQLNLFVLVQFFLWDPDHLVIFRQKPVDVHLSAFQSMEWIGTLPFKVHLCFDTEDYC